jgi:DNA polymerase elongation subunit (family B)
LADWYAKRKEYQKVMKDAKKEVAELEKLATPEKSSSSDVAYKKGWLPATVHAKLVETKKTSELFDLQQHTMKIFLNSTYGALLNQWFLYSDPRLGASTTGSGRQITTHMTEEISYISTGIRYPLTKTTHTEKGETHHVYTTDSPVTIYGDTDSVAGDSILKTSRGQISIEDLFLSASYVRNDGEKRHGFFDAPVECLTYDPHNKTAVYKRIREIYAHKTTKRRFKITDIHGNTLFVTSDHSCMIYRNDELIEVKPTEILAGDKLVTVCG